MKYRVTAREDICSPVRWTELRLEGETGSLCRNISDAWLKGVRRTNPAILHMFRERDMKPYRDLLPWSGEFAGKHITGAYYIYRITGDEELRREIEEFISEMIACQAEDGYLGCFARDCRLTGAFSRTPEKTGETWDSWNHYHILYGLLLWHGETGREEYLAAAEKIAALFLRKFYGENPPLSSIGSCEMNLAALHGFALLYRVTGKEEYLRFALEVERDFGSAGAGNYIENALKGIEFYQGPKPRWESLHEIMGILELYAATGREYYLTAARQIVMSILKTDVHNTGAFSTDEQAIGHPYRNSNIETCCVVAFNALALRLFRLTGDMGLLDFLERSHYNAMMGAFSPTGAWSTYNTPMDGEKRANFDSIQFQCRPGSPMLNCCSVNAPRGVGEAGEWMLMRRGDCLCVHLYESFRAEADGARIECLSEYPAPGLIRIRARGSEGVRRLALRLPGWSRAWACRTDGKHEEKGGYLWFPLDGEELHVELELDFSARFEKGERDYAGCESVFSGPVLYGAEAACNPEIGLDEMPPLRREALLASGPAPERDGSLVWTAGGLRLMDFYHLGAGGGQYRTWLKVE